ncbi:hypothetical protein JCM11641_001057 [Rhodosporidiobolus odoratus]
MHASLISTSRAVARASARSAVARSAFAARATAAPTFTSTVRLQSRLFRTSPFASSQTPLSSPSGPSPSPAPIDNEQPTSLPTEEIPAISSSLDASQVSSPATSPSSEPSSTAAPADSETATAPSTEETLATSSPVDAAAQAAADQEKVACTVFVGGLSWNVDPDWLEDEVLAILDRADGVSSVRIARDQMGRSKGFAFVELASPDIARQLIGTKPVIDGREVEFSPSTSPAKRIEKKPRDSSSSSSSAGSPSYARNSPTSTVWLGNVAWSADEALLEKIFRRFGEIKRIGQPKDFETGRSRGIAYIEFTTQEAAEAAVKVGLERGFRVDGRPVKVDFASAQKRGNNKGRLGSAAGGRRRETPQEEGSQY